MPATMHYYPPHSWDVSPQEAVQIQEGLRRKIIKDAAISRVRLVAGVDVGFPKPEVARAAVVTLSFPDLKVVAKQVAKVSVTFPYIPGLLAFREAPAVLAAIAKLEVAPDLFLFDAQGYAHPRRMGLATHLGIFLDKPAIGCAKSKLVGRYQVPGNRVGDRSDLIDKGEIIGAVVRARLGSPPLFISVGHKISLDEAVKYTLACIKRGRRLPEPTRLAHELASKNL